MSLQASSASTGRLGATARRVIAAPVRLQTYRNLLYLALAFPLGMAYFVGLVTGGAVGVGLLITWVGLPVLLCTLAGATLAASLEARLARGLVGVDTTVPRFIRAFSVEDGLAFPGDGFLDALKRLVGAPSTWISVLLVLTKFGFGLLSFVALVTTGALATVTIGAPLLYDDAGVTIGLLGGAVTDQYAVGPWIVDTFPEAGLVAVGGLGFLVIALNLLNALARLQAIYTAALLRIDSGEA